MLPSPPPPPVIEENTSTQPESSFRSATVAAPIQADPAQDEVGVGANLVSGIQHLALVLTRTPSLLKELHLFILIIKNALRVKDLHRLNEVKMDYLYDNIAHSTMESVLCAYMAKEHNKALRREFGAKEMDKNLLQKECLRLKTQVDKVEGTMKETLESVDKLQADASRSAFENGPKIFEDQVATLQCQVQELQS